LLRYIHNGSPSLGIDSLAFPLSKIYVTINLVDLGDLGGMTISVNRDSRQLGLELYPF
jgi:hypothetical protein